VNPLPQHVGVLLVGHGTRRRTAIDAFVGWSRQVQSLCHGVPAEPCFLEFAEPTIAQGIARLAGQGVRRIRAVPVFLLTGRHVRRDVPLAVHEAAAGHPRLVAECTPHLGSRPEVLESAATRLRQAVARRKPVAPHDTAVLLAARGSRDPAVHGEMLQFARQLRPRVSAGAIEPCYVSIGCPALSDAAPRLAAGGVRRVVVQPHLLLPGRMVDRVGRLIERFRGGWPQVDWVLSQPLGLEPVITRAVVELAGLSGCGRRTGRAVAT